MLLSIFARLGTLESLRRDIVRTLGWPNDQRAFLGSLRCLRDLLEMDIEREARMELH